MDRHGRQAGLLSELAGAMDESLAVAVVDCEGRLRSWSRGAEALLGYTPGEIVGRPLADLVVGHQTLRHRDGHVMDLAFRLCQLDDNGEETEFLFTVQEPAESATSADHLFVRRLFDQQPTVLVIFDLEGRILDVNERALRMAGRADIAHMRGQRTTEVFQGPAFDEIDCRVLRVARTGTPESLENFVRLPGELRAHAWVDDLFPLTDETGRTRAVGFAAADYSEQYGARERLALLGEARARIGGSLDVTGTAEELVAVAVPRYADYAGVELLEPVFRGEVPPPRCAGPGALIEAASEWAPQLPLQPALDGTGARTPLAWSSVVEQCLADGQPVFRESGSGETGHTLVAVPIRARGVSLGAALFVRCTASRAPFGPDDLVVAEDFVARAAICLDNARRYTRERSVALTLQRAMLPPGAPGHLAAETATRYLPADSGSEVGGDWFDVIPLPGARLGLVVGDVVGHGIHAAATMGRLRTAVRTLADIDLPPDELLTHLDDIVTHGVGEFEGDPAGETLGDFCATCLYAVYDPVSGTCCAARAGHPPPVLILADGSNRAVDLPLGPPLGLGSLPFEAAEFATPPGSLLALFTDGLITSRDRDLDHGLVELRRALARPSPSLERLSDSVLESMSSGRRTDDVALLLVRPRMLDENQVADWEVACEPAAVAEVRRKVADRLAAWGLEEDGFVTELVVSELVTNAIRYAAGPIRLRLIRERRLVCEVSDESSTAPHLRRARDFDEGGRGLFLVAQLTQRWGTRYTGDGKTIWAEQTLHQTGS
ncbi:SpoIIE family protein phosphatase [Streptomyces yaanensis]|uniref:SpoIIE family protein phosphatase n=1 Tax=Streptomyces yaanensis TaxID=1142239 RepID=A0ABV7SL97_9ACTN|nr:SpoIIE family protein phosphatase [Streptomyces sp. CGMCC 4.7035]WNC00415.1 SpoIIE family protein phosphatase [Streptomyces sp. CGMCC 4.7035]